MIGHFSLAMIEFPLIGHCQLWNNGPEVGTIYSFETPGSESVCFQPVFLSLSSLCGPIDLGTWWHSFSFIIIFNLQFIKKNIHSRLEKLFLLLLWGFCMYFIFNKFFGSKVSSHFYSCLLSVSCRLWFVTIVLLNFLSTSISTLSFKCIVFVL